MAAIRLAPIARLAVTLLVMLIATLVLLPIPMPIPAGVFRVMRVPVSASALSAPLPMRCGSSYGGAKL